MASLALGDEIEVSRVRGGHHRRDRLGARVRDGARRQPLVLVGAVAVVGIVVDGRRDFSGVPRARRELGRDEAPVASGGIALQEARVKLRIAQAVQEDAGDERPLVVDRRFFFDHRRQRHDLARPELERRHREIEEPRRVALLERDPALVELRLHAAHDIGGIAVGREIVGRRKEKALGAVAIDEELLQERGAGRRVEERAQRADLFFLEALGHVEARPPFREGDLHAPGARPSLEPRHDFARRRVVAQEVHAVDERARAPRERHIDREEAGARDDARRAELVRERRRRLVLVDRDLDRVPVAGSVARRIDEEPQRTRDEEPREAERDPAPEMTPTSARHARRRTRRYARRRARRGAPERLPEIGLALATPALLAAGLRAPHGHESSPSPAPAPAPARRASSHACKMAQADASSMRALAFLP